MHKKNVKEDYRRNVHNESLLFMTKTFWMQW
jgi:hypothetical protein